MRNKFIVLCAIIWFGPLIAGCLATGSNQAPAPNLPARSTAAASAPGVGSDWEKVLSDAKKEGQVTIYTIQASNARNALSQTFKEKY